MTLPSISSPGKKTSTVQFQNHIKQSASHKSLGAFGTQTNYTHHTLSYLLRQQQNNQQVATSLRENVM